MSAQIEEAKLKCIEAFNQHPDAEYAWCCHHEQLFEKLTQPFMERINYIVDKKPIEEQEARFNNFRPVLDVPEFLKLKEVYDKATKSAMEAREKAVKEAWEAFWKDTETVREAYHKATESARKAREEAIKPAWEAYHKATKPAWEAYQKAIKPALEAYEETAKSALEAYQKALQEALQEAQEPLMVIYRQEVPLGTWNGRSIFSQG